MAAFQEAMRRYAQQGSNKKTPKKTPPTLSSVPKVGVKKQLTTSTGRRIISLKNKRQSKSPASSPEGAMGFLSKISPLSSQSTPKRLKRSLSTPTSLRSLSGGYRQHGMFPPTPINQQSPNSFSKQSTKGVQTPLVSITYQNCSRPIRRKLDAMLQQLARDPKSRTSKSAEGGNMDRGCVQYFDSFCIDRYGIRDLPSGVNHPAELEAFDVPQYQGVVNVVALPIRNNPRSGKKDLKHTLGVCFNCGKEGHSARECKQKVDQQAIRENGRLFREFGNKGPKSKRRKKKRYHGRYYEESVLCEEVGIPTPTPSPDKRKPSPNYKGKSPHTTPINQSPHSRENVNVGINKMASGIKVVEDARNHTFPTRKRRSDDFSSDFSGGRGRGRGRGSRGRGSRGRGSRGRGSRGRGYHSGFQRRQQRQY